MNIPKLMCAALCLLIIACSNKKNDKKEDLKNTDVVVIEQKVVSAAEALAAVGMVDLSKERDIKTLLAQGWEMEDDLDALSDASANDDIMLPFRSFYLAPDNSFIKNPRNSIQFGSWSYNDAAKTLTLKYDDGGQDVYKIRAIAADELKLTDEGMNSITVLKYVSAGMRHSNIEDDPFYIGNNRWRIAPRKPESAEAIHKRLKESIRFFVLFYKDMIAKDAKAVSFYGLPSCLKFYGPGIFIQKKTELSEYWEECFYNDEQALKAYNIMDSVIEKKYDWPKEDIGWLKKNAAVLEQMYNNL